MEQDKKIQQNWTEAENFDNCFCTTLLQKIYFWKKDSGLYLQPVIAFSKC